MRSEEFRLLQELFKKRKKELPPYMKLYEMLEKPSNTHLKKNKLLVKLTERTVKPKLTEEVSSAPVKTPISTATSCISAKIYQQAYRVFMHNHQTKVNAQKKIATICVREARRSLSKTARINPILKGKRINREMLVFIRHACKEVSAKSQEKEILQNRKKQEEIEEANRQKRKFNYLLGQTEAFASYFINRKSSTNEDIEGIKAAKEQLKMAREFQKDSLGENNNDEEIYVHKEIGKPKILETDLRDYQLKGLNWLVSLYHQGISGILADDMGLGKTVQAISLLAYLYEKYDNKGPFIVITPASTLHNWVNEIEKFLPSFKIISFWGNTAERKEMRRRIKSCNIVVTSYQLAIADEAYLRKIKFQYMILDEAQAIKSNTSMRWSTLLKFKTYNRLLLTGTPIQNNMSELWSLLHFIMPTLFDSISEFSEWFSKEIENNSINKSQIEKLHTILKPFMLRRSKKDIKNEIGTKEIKIVECRLSSRQRKLYDRVLNSKQNYDNIVMQLKKICNHPDLLEKIQIGCSLDFNRAQSAVVVENKPSDIVFTREMANVIKDEKKRFLDALLEQKTLKQKIFEKVLRPEENDENPFIKKMKFEKRFQEALYGKFIFRREKAIPFHIRKCDDICEKKPASDCKRLKQYIDSHISIPPMNTFIADSGKLVMLESLLRTLKKEGHRVLIYFQMTKMMDLFEKYLYKKEFSFLRLDGSSKISARKVVVNTWQTDSSYFVFILSTRAGGVGINLTAADTVIFYDSDWNPTVDQQAMDRAHRIGQTKNVVIYKLIVKDTVEERIMEMARKKDNIQKIVIQEDVFTG